MDGIVGIGGRPGLRPDAVAALAAVPGVPVVAVDVPSGVDVDTGELDGPHVTADLTVTFGTHKVAHLVDPAAAACGVVHLVDIGLDLPEPPVEALQADDVAALLPRPAPDAHKYTRGVVGVRAGSAELPRRRAALRRRRRDRAGRDGAVRRGRRGRGPGPRAAPRGGRARAGCRPGSWAPGAATRRGEQLAAALADGVPVVVDADALAHVDGPLGVPAVLTPHAGELAAMLGAERAAVEAAARPRPPRRGAVRRRRAAQGPAHAWSPSPAGGSGSPRPGSRGWPPPAPATCSAGLIGALLAAGLAPYDAASVGSWLHGAAATLASRGGPLVAGDVARALPDVVRLLVWAG